MPTDARLLVLIQHFTNRLAVETDPVVRAGLEPRMAELKVKDQS
jgi:hypothetical protein